MSKASKGKPWHSKTSKVYHDNSKCGEGQKATPRLSGTGDKEHCSECGRLNAS